MIEARLVDLERQGVLVCSGEPKMPMKAVERRPRGSQAVSRRARRMSVAYVDTSAVVAISFDERGCRCLHPEAGRVLASCVLEPARSGTTRRIRPGGTRIHAESCLRNRVGAPGSAVDSRVRDGAPGRLPAWSRPLACRDRPLHHSRARRHLVRYARPPAAERRQGARVSGSEAFVLGKATGPRYACNAVATTRYSVVPSRSLKAVTRGPAATAGSRLSL